MRGYRKALIAFAGLFIPLTVMAATDTADMQVTATISPRCIITSVGNINFGQYNPLDSNPTNADGSITIRCVKRTNYDVYIAGERKMSGGENEQLNFQIYKDAARTQVFPSSSPGIQGQAPNFNPIVINAYGQIPAGQDIGIGNFSTTLTATVSY